MKFPSLVLAALAAASGWAAAVSLHGCSGVAATPPTEGSRPTRSRQCSMHPWVKSDQAVPCTVCGMTLVPAYESGTRSGRNARGMVLLAPGSVHALAVKTADVKRQPLSRTVRVAGIIGEDESRHGIISAPVDGRIDGLAMSCEGDKVTRREPLLTIFSRPLLAAANDYKLALKQDPVAVERAKIRLLQLGLVWEQIASIPTRQEEDIHFGILAPLSGTIVKAYVSEGQHVKEGEKLFEIADFRKMWFQFTADEPNLAFIQVGQLIELSTPASPGPPVKARVAFINPNLDELTRSSRVRVVLENPDGRFKNKMFAEGVVSIEVPEVLSVPRGAVLAPGDSPRVYVEQGAGVYAQRPVRLGRVGDACWEVLDGLKDGERVVLAGNLLIDAQAQLDAMAMGEESSHPSPTKELWCGGDGNTKRIVRSAEQCRWMQ